MKSDKGGPWRGGSWGGRGFSGRPYVVGRAFNQKSVAGLKSIQGRAMMRARIFFIGLASSLSFLIGGFFLFEGWIWQGVGLVVLGLGLSRLEGVLKDKALRGRL